MPCISGLEIDRPPNLCEWQLLPFYYCGRASTCVDTVARLFDILESGSLALTLAVFTIEPMLIGVTSIVTVAKAPVVRLPMVHMTGNRSRGDIPVISMACRFVESNF